MNHLPTSTEAQISDHALNHEQFQVAVAGAIRHFSLIRKKYPDLKASLVLSWLGEQTKIDSSPKDILREFPALVVDDKAKARMLRFLNEPLPEKPSEAQKKQWSERLRDLAEDLKFDGNVQVDLRFHNLNYDLIWKLQSDDLVDRDLTPQTKASIRIVLGTVDHFARLSSTEGAV